MLQFGMLLYGGSKDWEYYGDPETGNYASRIWTLGLNLTF